MDYHTKQKELILSCIEGFRDAHFGADDVVEALRERGSPVGKSTVYRYLEKLIQEGKAAKYASDGSACYIYLSDEACREHYHLKCVDCGRLIHTDCSRMDALGAHMLEEHGFALDGTRTILYGHCADCAKGGDRA